MGRKQDQLAFCFRPTKVKVTSWTILILLKTKDIRSSSCHIKIFLFVILLGGCIALHQLSQEKSSGIKQEIATLLNMQISLLKQGNARIQRESLQTFGQLWLLISIFNGALNKSRLISPLVYIPFIGLYDRIKATVVYSFITYDSEIKGRGNTALLKHAVNLIIVEVFMIDR